MNDNTYEGHAYRVQSARFKAHDIEKTLVHQGTGQSTGDDHKVKWLD